MPGILDVLIAIVTNCTNSRFWSSCLVGSYQSFSGNCCVHFTLEPCLRRHNPEVCFVHFHRHGTFNSRIFPDFKIKGKTFDEQKRGSLGNSKCIVLF
jgi:hypothetical protein